MTTNNDPNQPDLTGSVPPVRPDPEAQPDRVTAPPPRRAEAPWCGRCDHRTRLAEVTIGGHAYVRRCPDCHPLAGRVPRAGSRRNPTVAEVFGDHHGARHAQVIAYYAEDARRKAEGEQPQWRDREPPPLPPAPPPPPQPAPPPPAADDGPEPPW